ncbi:long-chain fatty acid transport protein 2-like [Glandiceps talaboti]
MDPDATKYPAVTRSLKITGGAAATAGVLNYFYPYWRYDVSAIRRGLRFKKITNSLLASKHFVVDLFIDKAQRFPYKPFVIYNNTIHTYKDIDIMSNKFANYVRAQGLKLGDTAAILMYNEPAFLWVYFGFAKLGISVALINYNLRGDAITHCMDVCNAKILVLANDNELAIATKEVNNQLQVRNIDVWIVGENTQGCFTDVSKEVNQTTDKPIPRETRNALSETDKSVFIFTSGTTGLPKAAIISHYRHLLGVFLPSTLSNAVHPDDRIYISLPLYHSSGFALGLGCTVAVGMTMVLGRKFSVKHFWDDCRRHNVTVFVYIGEICRYLLSAPKSPGDNCHSVRLAYGNGLRPDIWKQFQERFHIPVIGEIYGATEAPFVCVCDNNTIGAVGRFSPLLKFLTGFELIKCDLETAEPIRDSKGRVVPVKRGESGLLICPINEFARYDGYSGKRTLSEKKLIKNAFKDGDLYFNSGDLLVLDKNYYLYFSDRLGDTFRWKGENVATTEVAEAITSHPSIEEANVYGVKVPGQDGRAGMAAIVLKNNCSLETKEFYQFVTSALPIYACPRFIRVMKSLDTTGTFKYKKTDLVKEGFDPEVIPEPIYYMDMTDQTYKLIDVTAYRHIVGGKARL